MFPETIEAKPVFLRLFFATATASYNQLDRVCAGDLTADDYDEDEADDLESIADDIRLELANCVSEAAAILGWHDADEPEKYGFLCDWITETCPALGEFLDATTEQ